MRSPGRPLACALSALSLLALSATPALARAHHHRHASHRSGSKPSTLSSSAPSSVSHHDRRRDRTLPFTGFNLWVYALAGLGMLAIGLRLRRLTAARR